MLLVLRELIAAFNGILIYSVIYVAYKSWDSTTASVVGLSTPHYELVEAFDQGEITWRMREGHLYSEAGSVSGIHITARVAIPQDC